MKRTIVIDESVMANVCSDWREALAGKLPIVLTDNERENAETIAALGPLQTVGGPLLASHAVWAILEVAFPSTPHVDLRQHNPFVRVYGGDKFVAQSRLFDDQDFGVLANLAALICRGEWGPT